MPSAKSSDAAPRVTKCSWCARGQEYANGFHDFGACEACDGSGRARIRCTDTAFADAQLPTIEDIRGILKESESEPTTAPRVLTAEQCERMLEEYAEQNETLGAELAALRAERAATINAWEEYASHLEWCRWCAEDGIESCDKGRPLRDAARAVRPAVEDATTQETT